MAALASLRTVWLTPWTRRGPTSKYDCPPNACVKTETASRLPHEARAVARKVLFEPLAIVGTRTVHYWKLTRGLYKQSDKWQPSASFVILELRRGVTQVPQRYPLVSVRPSLSLWSALVSVSRRTLYRRNEVINAGLLNNSFYHVQKKGKKKKNAVCNLYVASGSSNVSEHRKEGVRRNCDSGRKVIDSCSKSSLGEKDILRASVAHEYYRTLYGWSKRTDAWCGASNCLSLSVPVFKRKTLCKALKR